MLFVCVSDNGPLFLCKSMCAYAKYCICTLNSFKEEKRNFELTRLYVPSDNVRYEVNCGHGEEEVETCPLVLLRQAAGPAGVSSWDPE